MITDTYSDTQRKALAATVVLAVCAFCALVTWRLSTRLDQTLVAGILMFVAVQLAIVSPRTAIICTLIFIPISGDLRRIMLFYIGKVDRDPLLLVGPASLGILLLVLIFKGQLDLTTRFSRMIFCLSILMVLQVFNPLQGSLTLGLVGVLFFLVPLSWYWIGQHYGSEEFMEKVFFFGILPVAIAASAYSLHQLTFGLSDYQLHWLEESGMKRMNLMNVPRPLAFFNSAQECGMFMGVASVFLMAAALTGRNRKLLFLLPLFLVVVAFQGSRGTVVVTLFTMCVMWAVNGRAAGSWITRMTRALIFGFGSLIYILTTTSSLDASTPVAPILSHHSKGLTRPGESTLPDHLKMAAWGVYVGTIKNPIGYGIGATTIAANEVADDEDVGNMEVDISNLFISLGVGGGILYVFIVVHIFRRAVRLWTTTYSFTALAIFGTCVILAAHYLTGTCYSTAAFSWFAIGALDWHVRHRLHVAD
jgi:hypothetical protein